MFQTESLEETLHKLAESNCKIPKPKSDKEFRILRIGRRRNQDAIIYSIPNNKDENQHYEKGITFSEFRKALIELQANGCITRDWFNKNLQECASEGTCNFTSLCGILELLGYCEYTGRGKYEVLKK